MRTIAPEREPLSSDLGGFVGVGPILFMGVFLFFWITTTPFIDLTGAAVLDPSAANSNRLNQVISLGLFAAMLCFGMFHPLRTAILQPRALLLPMFAWFFFVSLISAHPILGIKAVILTIIASINASIYLLLPASQRQFAKMLAIGTLIMLATAYFGVLFKPELSIHQASELREPMNAGMWRGHFPHKNSAAAAMVIAAFFGLFVFHTWSRLAGVTIVILSVAFLMQTGGKTSSAMLPGILILAWLFEHIRFLRMPIVIGGVGLFNLFAVGSAVFRPLGELVTAMGIDATFTNRADIWRFAFTAIADNPITGYGVRAFWQTDELVYSGGNVETWAVAAANGHNSYLDIALTTGIPGLLLTLVWILILPLRDIARLPEHAAHSHLTRLYTRVWLYVIFNAGLETIFFEGGNLLWFTFLFCLYGLRFQAFETLKGGSKIRREGSIA